MWLYTFLFYVPLTILFLGMAIVGAVYLLMGFRQLITGFKEKDAPKKNGGLIAMLLSLLFVTGIVYVYFKWIWLPF